MDIDQELLFKVPQDGRAEADLDSLDSSGLNDALFGSENKAGPQWRSWRGHIEEGINAAFVGQYRLCR